MRTKLCNGAIWSAIVLSGIFWITYGVLAYLNALDDSNLHLSDGLGRIWNNLIN